MSNDTPVRSPFSDTDPTLRAGGLEPDPYVPPYSPPERRPKFQHKLRTHVSLFVITLLTTTTAGTCHYASFVSDLGQLTIQPSWGLLLGGLWYSGAVLLILTAHEMGHYLYCRRYNVDATLPYFIPLPPLVFLGLLTGTLGAVIRIREQFPNRKALFDIGIAGPIGGFLVLVPTFFVGLWLSTVIKAPPRETVIFLGEPLLFQWGVRLVFGTLPDTLTVNMHPIVFACWVGMLATALNLLPFGQLDGGHIAYAALRRWAAPISLAVAAGAVVMTFVSLNWLLIAVLMIAMLVLLGPQHPQVIYEDQPLGRGRIVLAVFALLMLVVCVTPFPIDASHLVRNP